MDKEELEQMLGRYLDNIVLSVDDCKDYLERVDLSDEDRGNAIDLIKERIREAM